MFQLRLLGHVIFNITFFTFFWGAFEFAYTLGTPIWSGTFEGLPIPHHYLIGAILSYICYLLLTKNDFLKSKNIMQDILNSKKREN